MATDSHTHTFDQTQETPPGICRTIHDVRACTARVRAFRAQAWPAQRPVPQEPQPAPVTPPAALPAISEAVPGRVTVRAVVETTAAHFGLTVDVLLSHERKQPLVRRRQIAMYVAHRLTGRSYPFIARIMGDRDHTTVLHGKRTAEALIDAGDLETIAAVNAIVAQVEGGAHD